MNCAVEYHFLFYSAIFYVNCYARYKIVEPPDGLYGTDVGNGSWNGIIGMIQRRVGIRNACRPNVKKSFKTYL